MKRVLLNIILLSLPFSGAFSQLFPQLGGQRAGISALTFLKTDVSPRSSGMGGAILSMSGDAYAPQWNPASTTGLDSWSFAASNSFWPAGLNHAFLSAIRPDKKLGNLGLAITSLTTGRMEKRTELQPNGTGEYFYASNTAVALNYSRKLTDMFSYGMNIKYVNEQLDQFYAHTVLVDLGFRYQTDFKDLSFAVTLMNFGLNSRLQGELLPDPMNPTDIALEAYPPPTLFQIGISMVPVKTENLSLAVALQLNHPNDNSENIRIGTEFEYRNLLFVRAGYKINVPDQSLPTMGAGMRYRIGKHPARFDYSVEPTRYLGWIHRIGLSFQINKEKREVPNEVN